MKKIVFLDIDGVLNHQEFYKEKPQQIRDKEAKEKRLSIYYGDIDPSKIKLLNSLVRQVPSIEFVISSTWRMLFSLDELKTMFKTLGFEGEIVGVTPVGDSIRGLEIRDYLNNNECDGYVIVDDDIDMLYEQRNNFCSIDNIVGLTFNDLLHILNLLKIKGYYGEQKND